MYEFFAKVKKRVKRVKEELGDVMDVIKYWDQLKDVGQAEEGKKRFL